MRPKHPIDSVVWRHFTELIPNDYNPNHVFGPERDLLAVSICTDGWTQPIVTHYGDPSRIVDGFHRRLVVEEYQEVSALTNGMVPTVAIQNSAEHELMAATVRHNRARGRHGVLAMGEIVRKLIDALGTDKARLALGMGAEELNRLADERPSPERTGVESFGRGWVPKK